MKSRSESHADSHGRKKILIAEDDPHLARVVEQTLEEKGYAAHVAFDGVDAINYILLSKPDLVLLDLTLPRLQGKHICEMLSENESLRQTPIIVISGHAELVCKLHLFELGVDDYVIKPFIMEELLARIVAVLERNRRRSLVGYL